MLFLFHFYKQTSYIKEPIKTFKQKHTSMATMNHYCYLTAGRTSGVITQVSVYEKEVV